MKTVTLPKAVPIGKEPVEDTTILINGALPIRDIPDLKEVEVYYDNQARILIDALLGVLPQGIIEPLTIKLLEQRVSMYTGRMRKE